MTRIVICLPNSRRLWRADVVVSPKPLIIHPRLLKLQVAVVVDRSPSGLFRQHKTLPVSQKKQIGKSKKQEASKEREKENRIPSSGLHVTSSRLSEKRLSFRRKESTPPRHSSFFFFSPFASVSSPASWVSGSSRLERTCVNMYVTQEGLQASSGRGVCLRDPLLPLRRSRLLLYVELASREERRSTHTQTNTGGGRSRIMKKPFDALECTSRAQCFTRNIRGKLPFRGTGALDASSHTHHTARQSLKVSKTAGRRGQGRRAP
ncbi:hypothetical protein QBC35DRAFT_129722 [Podospora australis]|uniref:Uncharacterized protein n=1 Tax=Podospora australis TaxID=1536484 RepID=A0AAN6WYT5_9PEZI|nr:hypothetical protein QBC35DRAFT_129722 [Podospora australis]